MLKGREAVFLTIRGFSLVVLLVWMLMSLTGNNKPELMLLFVFVVLFWFCFSLLVDLIWPASDSSAVMRHSVFAMIDVYIAVSFLVILHDKVLVAGAVVVIYCAVVTIFHGIAVGLVSAMAGVLGLFNSRGIITGADFIPLILMFASGVTGSGLGFLMVFLKKRHAEKAELKLAAEASKLAPEAGAEPVVVESREELLEKVRVMQENFDKVCKERDQLQEEIAQLEDKLQKEE
ncbi:MAG: hypothetical protein A2283_07135 [Lentisphaerae bacterium RIFOXYA12_FULL_48_11]|nr:MAG: hypothetical protein A2283_07135 [Lentisphaerae bacterium RIFOXYA12_FULL_48_11]